MTHEEQQLAILLFGFFLGGYHSVKAVGTIFVMPLLSPIYMLLFTSIHLWITK